MDIRQCILTKNDCYKKAQKITPKGIVVHSTGANNPYLKRYVQPDDGVLGDNKYDNDWNRSGLSVCVHAFIGKDKNGTVRVYQTLPFNYACWGVGNGSKGSYNYNPAYIQFEICEDALTDKKYFTEAFNAAIEFCAYLVKEYNLSVDNIVSHKEAHARGYGSNHGDCDHWLKKFGKDMNWFRAEVKAKVNTPAVATTETIYRVRKTWADTKSQIGAYKSLDNAKKACKSGYSVFDSKGNVVYTVAIPAAIKVGSTVKLKDGAKTYTGGSLAKFVYKRNHKVKQINGNRVVITYLGITVAAVNIKDLTLVK
jgi:N-acetylmuramoyl-L-alanine amidase CwlA